MKFKALTTLLAFLLANPIIAGVGNTLNALATIGQDTSALDFYHGVSFPKDVCLNRAQYPNSQSQECDKACSCNGIAPACASTPGWDKISRFTWTTWYMKYLVDLTNDLMKEAEWSTSGFNSPPAHTLPPTRWDYATRGLNVGYCVLSLVNGIMIAHSYAVGGNCQANYMMAVNGTDVLCQVALAAATCGEVLQFAGPAYAAYVSSGAQLAVGALSGGCATGKFMADRMKCAVSEKSCLAGVDAGRGLDVKVGPDGRSRANQCCRCDRQMFWDRTWPRRDVPISEKESWGSVVSSAKRDIECEGRPGRKYSTADTSGARRSLYYAYTDCRRAEPGADGQCWISHP